MKKSKRTFELRVQDFVLRITAPEELAEECRAAALSAWEQVHAYSLQHPEFRNTRAPLEVPDGAPNIVREMAAVARAAGVGPGAAAQGAVTDHVGRYLARVLPEVVISSGGDYFIKGRKRLRLGLHQGAPGGLALIVDPRRGTGGVFTNMQGISVNGDVVDGLAVLASSCALADAAAAAVLSRLEAPNSFRDALALIRHLDGVQGAVVVQGRRIGVAGAVELAS